MVKQVSKQVSEKTLQIDPKILCLFPSLDFTRPNTYAKSIERRKKRLNILALAANSGYVTEYSLKKAKIGSQTAVEVLRELRKLGLLRIRVRRSEKNTPRKEHILTAKGLIACTAMSDFQKTEKIAGILKTPDFKENELATWLKIFNGGYVRMKTEEDRKEISALVTLLREFGSRGFNLELKTEENIKNDLVKIEESCFDDTMKFSMLDFVEGFTHLIASTDEESQQQKRDLILLLNYSLKTKDSQPDVAAEQTRRFIQALMNMTSPICVSWVKNNNVKFTHDDLMKAVDKKLEEWKIEDVKDFGQRAEYVTKAVQQVMFEQLQKMLE